MNLQLSTPDFKQKKSVSKRQKWIFAIFGLSLILVNVCYQMILTIHF